MVRYVIGVLSLVALLLQAANAEEQSSFVRVKRDDSNRATALETSIVRFAPVEKNTGSPFYVDLVSAVHIGEKSYYEALNREFPSYDAVLYELIADKSTAENGDKPEAREATAAEKSLHPISMLQLAIKDFLKLEFQLQGVNYSAKNFVHADMSPDEFSRSMEERNESFLQIFMRALMLAYAKELSGEGKPPDLSMLLLLIVKDRSPILKRVMAEQFDDMESVLEALNGPEGSTIVSERNKVALQRLKEQRALGKNHFAIFYGGAHMPDMAARLVSDFKLAKQSVRWLTAWKLQ